MPPFVRWIALGVLSSALLMIVVDMTVLYVALPAITRSLEVTASEKLWITNIYAVTIAGLLPTTGVLSDRFGAKRLLLSGLSVFTIASVLAAFSPSAGSLIFARVLLAFGAALMMPATLSLIRQIFEDPNERSLAIGIWAAVASGGAAIGPVLGGLLLEYNWWGSVFLVNLPIATLAMILALRILPRSRQNSNKRIDALASIQIMVGLICVTYAIKEIGKVGGSALVAVSIFMLGIMCLVLFKRRQSRGSSPLIDFGLFKFGAFSCAVAVAMISSAAIVGLEFSVSQYFQLVAGLTALQTGLTILPIPLAAFVAGPTVGILLPHFKAESLLWVSLALASSGVALLLYAVTFDQEFQTTAFALIGFGLGGSTTAASSTILMAAPTESAGAAASIEEVSFELGSALGITVFGSLLAAMYATAFKLPSDLAAAIHSPGSIDAALLAADSLGKQDAITLLGAAHTAFGYAFNSVLLTAAAVLAATSLSILAITAKRRRGAI